MVSVISSMDDVYGACYSLDVLRLNDQIALVGNVSILFVVQSDHQCVAVSYFYHLFSSLVLACRPVVKFTLTRSLS